MQQKNGHTNNGTPGQGRAAAEEQTMTNTMWRCVQWRAGQILNKVLFNTKSEAETFCAQTGVELTIGLRPIVILSEAKDLQL
jgi:hypothetical protein